MVDNCITEENFKSHFKYEFIPKKIESHLSNFIVYDLETHITDRARPYNMTFYRLSKIAGRYNRDPKPEELQKSIKDTIAFSGDDCINNALDYLSKLKGEERKVNNKIVEYNLQMHAHNGSGFDTWIVLNNLPYDKHIIEINKNGKGIIELKTFNGLIYKNIKQFPQNLHFRCGMTHLNYSSKKLGKKFKLPKELLKTEMNHDEINGDNYKDKKDQYHKSKHCDDILKIINKELAVKGTVYDTIEAYMEYKNKHFKIFEKEYEDQFDDYRLENVEEKEKYINEKLSQLRLHKIIKRIELIELLWDFDAVSLYPSAMWDENSIYPRIETGYDYTRDMNNELVEKFNTGNFNQGSAILEVKYCNQRNLFVQQIPVKEKEKKIEIYRMRNGYIIHTLTSVDIQEIVKI